MIVKTTAEAWEAANKMFPTDYQKDEESSQRAGYPIYRSTAADHYSFYICDLNDRLEVNMNGEHTPHTPPIEKIFVSFGQAVKRMNMRMERKNTLKKSFRRYEW